MSESPNVCVAEIKEMDVFSGIDWGNLLETEPFWVPEPEDATDTTYFEGWQIAHDSLLWFKTKFCMA